MLIYCFSNELFAATSYICKKIMLVPVGFFFLLLPPLLLVLLMQTYEAGVPVWPAWKNILVAFPFLSTFKYNGITNRIMTNKVNNIEDCSSPLWCFDKLAYAYNYRSQILGCDNFVCIYLLKKKKIVCICYFLNCW